MEFEQLKLVVELLKDVSHDAGSLAALWVWLQFGSSALHAFTMVAVVIAVVTGIAKAYRARNSDQNCERFVREMRDTLRTGTSGCLDDGERDRTQALLRKLAEDYVAQKNSK